MTRILLIEDDSNLRTLLAEVLTRGGYEVIEACNGEEAVRLFRKAPADLVVTDVLMPRLNGLEACGRIRRNHPTVSVIVISEMHDEDLLLRAFQAGASAMLRKHEVAQELPAALHVFASSHFRPTKLL